MNGNALEQIVEAYLRYQEKCAFVDGNIVLNTEAGEIDLVGLSPSNKKIYVCEATASFTGYGSIEQTAVKFSEKFRKAKTYVDEELKWLRSAYPDWAVEFQVWAPYVGEMKLEQVRRELGKFKFGLKIFDAVAFLEAIKNLQGSLASSNFSSVSGAAQVIGLLAGVQKKVKDRDTSRLKRQKQQAIAQ